MSYSPYLSLSSCPGHLLSSTSVVASYKNYVTVKSLLKYTQYDLASNINPLLFQDHFLSSKTGNKVGESVQWGQEVVAIVGCFSKTENLIKTNHINFSPSCAPLSPALAT